MATRYKFVRGHYTASYNGSDIGTTRSGFRIRQRVHTEPITVDESGDVPVDAINRGTEYAIEVPEGMEFAKLKAAISRSQGSSTPFGIGQGMVQIGALQTDLVQSLILAPATGNAAGNATITYTAAYSIVEGDVDIPLQLGVKRGALTFICYPNPNASTNATAHAIVESGSAEGT
jgi:hypothetical protein